MITSASVILFRLRIESGRRITRPARSSLPESAGEAVEDGLHDVIVESPLRRLDLEIGRHSRRRLETIDLSRKVVCVQFRADDEGFAFVSVRRLV